MSCPAPEGATVNRIVSFQKDKSGARTKKFAPHNTRCVGRSADLERWTQYFDQSLYVSTIFAKLNRQTFQ